MGTTATRNFLIAGLLATLALPLRAEIVQQILVKVNGDIVTKTDLEQRQIAVLRQRNEQLSEQDLKNDEKLKAMLDQITPDILLDSVDELLMIQRARDLGYRLGDDQFKQIIENIKKENKIETDEQFQAALKGEGMTLADLRRSLERQMLVGRVQQLEVFGKVSVTEPEERAYYQAHQQEFIAPAAVTLREILISVPTQQTGGGQAFSAGVDEAAREKIDAARRRATGGEDFAQVAGEVSEAPSKANGGLIGPLSRSDLTPELQELLSKLKPGEVSPPLRTDSGYLLIKLESSSDATAPPFEQVRDKVAEKVFDEKRVGELEKYLKKLRTEAIIEWKHDELHKAYDKALAARSAKVPAE